MHEQRAIESSGAKELKISGYTGVIDKFRDYLNSNSVPQTDFTNNSKSLAMVPAAIERAESGKKNR